MSIKLVMLFNHLILCHHLLLLPLIFPSIRVFSNESTLRTRWRKYWSFSISLSNEYSFRIDWFDTLSVQGTFQSLLQYHNPKASILQHSTFFMIQLSHPYITTGKIIPLSAKWWLCFLICCLGLSSPHLPRSRHLLRSILHLPRSFPSKEQVSFHFMAAVTIHSDFEAQEFGIQRLSTLHLP